MTNCRGRRGRPARLRGVCARTGLAVVIACASVEASWSRPSLSSRVCPHVPRARTRRARPHGPGRARTILLPRGGRALQLDGAGARSRRLRVREERATHRRHRRRLRRRLHIAAGRRRALGHGVAPDEAPHRAHPGNDRVDRLERVPARDARRRALFGSTVRPAPSGELRGARVGVRGRRRIHALQREPPWRVRLSRPVRALGIRRSPRTPRRRPMSSMYTPTRVSARGHRTTVPSASARSAGQPSCKGRMLSPAGISDSAPRSRPSRRS